MDIIVRLSDGSLANVEIQKVPYRFTAERISCYSSDLLMREYSCLKKDKNFNYSDMKKVLIYMFSKALKIADKNTVKYMIEELQDKATHEAKLRKQEAELRKQTEAELQQSRENEQKLQKKIAELEAMLAPKH